ncbi:chemotaxis protein [Geobacter sp. DSM 9736]|uniref:chemotaxis protein n=1 Tax=Geobacter sp. DSM 9736 TaxID=1277350 RepID=UPI000B50230D|nr:chemotaxis protein [Geobacter sp. DSM 9736]SNB45637.1 two-component system, chemotaxis family, response regulator CheV [Geobacter sp. DSM 9736]
MENSNNAVLLESDTNELEIVEFRIDEYDDSGQLVPCHYGVNVAKVREIIRLPQLWKAFNSQPAVAGMIKLRDKVITVINLAERLNKRIEGMEPDRVIVLEFNRLVVGVLVHSVSRIYRISWEQVEPPVKVANSEQVTGLVKMDDRIILVLDFEKIVGELCGQYVTAYEMLPDPDTARSRRILVADDSPFIRNTMCSSLRAAGHLVEEAENGEEAWNIINEKLQRCRERQVPIKEELDLLITDVEMPRMDGLHLTSRVRKEAALKDLPVVIFSSLASEDNIRKWSALGANQILTKPDLPNLVCLAEQLTG